MDAAQVVVGVHVVVTGTVLGLYAALFAVAFGHYIY